MSIIVEEEKSVKRIVKILNDINQIIKNVYSSDDKYFYLKGKLYCISSNQLPQFVECEINEDKDELVNRFFLNNNFSINGKELFDFINKEENKKTNKINYIQVTGDNTIIFKKNQGQKLIFDFDIEKEFHEKFVLFSNTKNSFKELLFDEKLDNQYIDKILNNSNSVYRFILDIDDNKVIIDNNRSNDKYRNAYIEITLSKKFILGLKIKKLKSGYQYNETKVKLYDNGENDNLYLVKFEVYNDLCVIKQYFIIVDVI